MDELKYWIWLTNIPGVGSAKALKLLQYYETPRKIWNASQGELKGINGLSKQDIDHLNNKDLDKTEKILEDMKRLNIRAVTIQDPEYPERLKHIYKPPCILYVRGDLKPSDTVSIAMVGSRRASPYGKKVAETLAYELAGRGITIVSGMARGIDTFAHKGTLKAGRRTVAVLGCGIDVVYPKENRELMGYIVKSGAVISEYPPGTPPVPANFPARNRIISGISLGTLVIEAGEKSGSLITADFALEQGREVFAIPGNIDSASSRGTNNLIKQGAKLVSCVEDILEEIAGILPNHTMNNKVSRNDLPPVDCLTDTDLSSDEKVVMGYLTSIPLYIDELCLKTGYSIQKLNTMLTLLEMRGYVRQLPGKQFITA